MKKLNDKNLKKAASTAKKAALAVPKTVLNVPVAVGRTILSVPKTVAGAVNVAKEKNKNREKNNEGTKVKIMGPKYAEKLAFINREIVEEQERRWLVRESQTECMKEIIAHLGKFLNENPDALYEEWIAALHPENAEYVDPNQIDHRFYLEDSDHRLLWNEFMTIMMEHKAGAGIAEAEGAIHIECNHEWSDRIVEVKKMSPSYNRSTT